MSPEEVIELFAHFVVGKYPVPSGVIAQLILEVGFDLKTPKDRVTGKESYNLGNIKGTGPAGSVEAITTEYYSPESVEAVRRNGDLVREIVEADGKTKVLVKQRFCAYHHYGEAIDDLLLLLKKDRYVHAGVWKARTPLEYAEAIKKGWYATDPHYVDKMMAIVNRNHLTRFDPINQEEDETLKLENWQWEMLLEMIENVKSEGLLSWSDWSEKVKKKELTTSELSWLNAILIGRMIEAQASEQTKEDQESK